MASQLISCVRPSGLRIGAELLTTLVVFHRGARSPRMPTLYSRPTLTETGTSIFGIMLSCNAAFRGPTTRLTRVAHDVKCQTEQLTTLYATNDSDLTVREFRCIMLVLGVAPFYNRSLVFAGLGDRSSVNGWGRAVMVG